MEKIFNIKEEKSNDSSFILNDCDDNNSRNFIEFKPHNDINFYEKFNIFKKNTVISEVDTIKGENSKKILDIFSKDKLKAVNNELSKNQKANKQKSLDLNIYVTKEVVLENDKYAKDSLLRRAKKIIFDAMLKYNNYVISKIYDNNIGNGIKIKKLLKINHFQIQNTNTNYNKELLKTPQGVIFSSNISSRHTNYPLNHNKLLINKLLNEENEEKRKIFNELFSRTFSECLNHLIGKKIYKSLEGLENFYEKELLVLDESDKSKDLLKSIINNYEIIIEKKRSRKRKILK